MRCIQFDENLSAAHLRRACQDEGLVTPLRFPRGMSGHGIKDEDVIARFLSGPNLFVTNDRMFIEGHLSCVPALHCGVLIVIQDADAIGEMTTHKAQSILRDFKKDYPEWPMAPWHNSVIYLSQGMICVKHVAANSIEQDRLIHRKTGGWNSDLSSVLSANAARGTPQSLIGQS